jgi:hypothetical protein
MAENDAAAASPVRVRTSIGIASLEVRSDSSSKTGFPFLDFLNKQDLLMLPQI